MDLSAYNSFGLKAIAERFVTAHSLENLRNILTYEKPRLILGGGSNMLLVNDLNGLVIHNTIKEKRLIAEDEDFVWLRFGAGENWHECVIFSIENGWGGIENLSLIPGTMGAAPIQNIGAYGVELKDVFDSLDAVRIEDNTLHTFSSNDCQFGYRNSVFKQALKGKYIITSVVLKLRKHPVLNMKYGAIKQTIESLGLEEINIKSISDAVIHIRQSKLPDPKVIGNAGSFFKNPIITKIHFEKLEKQFPNIVHYPVDDQHVKVPAGWLIDQAGWKGKQVGQTGTHKNQALVLVNHGHATGEEIYAHAQRIQADILKVYDIKLEMEVNLIA